MAARWIIPLALALALSSCSAARIDGSTRQFPGVWLYEFEGSTFIEGAARPPTSRPAYRTTDWLEYPPTCRAWRNRSRRWDTTPIKTAIPSSPS